MIRRARVEDAVAIATVHIASSDDAYAPLARAWPEPDPAKRAAMWAKSLADSAGPVFVAEDDSDAVIGFSGAGSARRSEPGADVEVHVLHVLPAFRGRGVGDALWTAACREIRGPELASMYVETLAELPAAAFYACRGGELVEKRQTDFHGAPRTQVTFRWRRGQSHDRR